MAKEEWKRQYQDELYIFIDKFIVQLEATTIISGKMQTNFYF